MNLSNTELLILAAVEAHELYGREITIAVAERTDGKRRIGLAGLYTTLHRMEEKGLIGSRWGDDDEAREGARRRYYRITGVGQRALRDVRQALRAPFRRRLAWGDR